MGTPLLQVTDLHAAYGHAEVLHGLNLEARQGSVAAIIQLLNEHFADNGIRTRAIQDNGVLQLLVEAPAAEALPQETVVDQVHDRVDPQVQ